MENKNSKRTKNMVPRKKRKRTKITESKSPRINDFPDDILCQESTISQSSIESMDDFADEILIHILSFLPIKEAFRTSILSKRWLLLCYSVPVIYYDDNVKIHLPQFMNAVMLSPHSQHKTLKSLTLKFYSCSKFLYDTPPYWFTFDTWMEAAKRLNLEKLNISCLFGIPLVPTIFCCKTLVVLKLKSIRVATMFHCSVDLPLLETFRLSSVHFEHMEDLMKLVSGCPKLLHLRAKHVTATTGVTSGGYFKVPLPKLVSADVGLFEVPLRAVSNVELLCLTKIWGYEPYNTSESLVDEEINSYYKDYPVFENLIKLQLYWISYPIHDCWDYEVVTMLQNCPKLEVLSIIKTWSNCSTTAISKEDWKYPDHVSECVSSHLTTCKIFDYHSVEADFRFVTYILQNAILLEVMEIHYSKNQNSMENHRFIEDLSSIPRISPVCKLSIIPR